MELDAIGRYRQRADDADNETLKPLLLSVIGCHLIEGAGHWVQQEQPDDAVRLLLEFLRD